MQYNVVKNAKRNIVWGTANKLLVMICPFITRTIVRYILGVEFLGLDSLFASIISVLSLTELGLSSAIVYHLYKPVAENDVKTVNAILSFYRSAYRVIGLVILVLGVCVIPFLPNLINGTYPEQIVLWKIYLLFLFNTVVSYFMFAYMAPLITVHQREDINSNINSLITILSTIFRLALLYFTKNYYFYLLLLPIFTVLSNLLIAYRVRTTFPQYRCEGKISADILSELKKLIAGTFIQKACALTRNSLDSICVSFFLGLTATAIYTNYYYISSSITAFLAIISLAFAGGIGNHVVTKSVEENYNELRKLDFIYLWISGWCTICLFCLYQPFMELWMGKDNVLDYSSVALFCIYFYLLKLGDMRSLYSTANGLWWKMRWRSIVETIVNIVLNILLGKYFGINGIIAATAISLLVCNCIWSAQILFTSYFGKEYLFKYYRYQAVYSVITFVILVATFFVCNRIMLDNQVFELVIKLAILIVFPNVLYVLVYGRTTLFKESVKLIRRK